MPEKNLLENHAEKRCHALTMMQFDMFSFFSESIMDILGQIVHKRNFNSRATFFDIFVDSKDEKRISLLFKEDICPDYQDIKRGKFLHNLPKEPFAINKIPMKISTNMSLKIS